MFNTCCVEAENGKRRFPHTRFHYVLERLGFVSAKPVMIFSWWYTESVANWCMPHVLKQEKRGVSRSKGIGHPCTLCHFPNRKASICDGAGNKYIFPISYTKFSSLKLSWRIFILWPRAVRTEHRPDLRPHTDRAPSCAVGMECSEELVTIEFTYNFRTGKWFFPDKIGCTFGQIHCIRQSPRTLLPKHTPVSSSKWKQNRRNIFLGKKEEMRIPFKIIQEIIFPYSFYEASIT